MRAIDNKKKKKKTTRTVRDTIFSEDADVKTILREITYLFFLNELNNFQNFLYTFLFISEQHCCLHVCFEVKYRIFRTNSSWSQVL